MAVVGQERQASGPPASSDLPEDVAEYAPNLTLFTGGYLSRSRTSDWLDFQARWGRQLERAVVPIDAAARRHDVQGKAWRHSFSEPGVRQIGGATWWYLDVVSQERRWRLLFLDGDRAVLAEGWQDQRTWIPKVVSGDEFDHLLVVTSKPRWTLARGGSASTDVGSLLSLVQEHAGPTRLMAVVGGSTGVNEVLLPDGWFGALHLGAGNSGVSGSALGRQGSGTNEQLVLPNGFDAALVQLAQRQGQEPSITRDAFLNGLQLSGWWQIELAGSDIQVAFRTSVDGTYSEIYRTSYDPGTGWFTVTH